MGAKRSLSAAQCRRSWDSAGRGSWRWFSSSSSPFTSGAQVLPGYLRARQNWRRTSSLAARVSRNPPPVAAPPPPPPAFLNALASLNASVGLVNANRLAVAAPPLPNFVTAPALPNPPPGAPLPAPAEQGGARSRLQAMASEVRTPIGRSRQRSRSMTSSPSALLEEYKTRWTCKVPFWLKHPMFIFTQGLSCRGSGGVAPALRPPLSL